MAELLDIQVYALKCLLNHADGGDVTAGYVVARDPNPDGTSMLTSEDIDEILKRCENR